MRNSGCAGHQSERFSPAFSHGGPTVRYRSNPQDEGNVLLRRPGGKFFLSAEEWAASLCLPALFAPHLLRSRTWPLSPGDNRSVSDEDAFDFAELLEIAL